jgi:glycosyltransferase involved in cell wall biosynthesis
MEFIFSDDCSTDRTIDIMQEMANAYKGQHKIYLNRNESNKRPVKHVSIVNNMSHGDIFIYSAGDDISMPDRTRIIVNTFVKQDGPSLIISNAIKFSNSGKIIGLLNPDAKKMIRVNNTHPLDFNIPGFNGCTIAIRRELAMNFPEPFPSLLAEDTIHIRRAALLNGITYLPDVLVKYRIHDNNLSHKKLVTKQDYISNSLKWLKDIDTQYKQLRVDIDAVSSIEVIDPNQKIRKYEESNMRRIKIIEGGFFQGMYNIALEFFCLKDVGVLKEVSRMFVSKWFPTYMGYKKNNTY